MKQLCECGNTSECGLDKGFTLGEKWSCKKEAEATKQRTIGSTLSDLLACTANGTISLSWDNVRGKAGYGGDDGDYWCGSIVDTTDLITFEARTIPDLKKEFINAVKDWRETRQKIAAG